MKTINYMGCLRDALCGDIRCSIIPETSSKECVGPWSDVLQPKRTGQGIASPRCPFSTVIDILYVMANPLAVLGRPWSDRRTRGDKGVRLHLLRLSHPHWRRGDEAIYSNKVEITTIDISSRRACALS